MTDRQSEIDRIRRWLADALQRRDSLRRTAALFERRAVRLMRQLDELVGPVALKKVER